MRRVVLIGLTIVCALGAAIVTIAHANGFVAGLRGESLTLSQKAQQKSQKQDNKNKKPKPFPSPSPFPIYNPYPPGILPDDLESEIERVLREIDVLEARAIARWQALPPPNLTGQPPTFQGSGTEMVETLGELMNYDKNMSPGRNQACASCHNLLLHGRLDGGQWQGRSGQELCQKLHDTWDLMSETYAELKKTLAT